MRVPMYVGVLLLCVAVIQFVVLAHLQEWIFYGKNNLTDYQKYVGFRLNQGRLGNQLYHLLTGYGIARTLNRTHYLSMQHPAFNHAARYLLKFKSAFPRLLKTFAISPYDANETRVGFAKSQCCIYDDPRRLSNFTDKYLYLTMIYGQNPRYFEEYNEEIREYLQFSEEVKKEGNEMLRRRNITRSDFMCLHIRRTDFIVRNVSTDMATTLDAAKNIAKWKNLSIFFIFGDDKEFMHNLSVLLTDGNTKNSVALISNFTEVVDFYVSSQICSSFLITAVTSSFGFFLAFFSRNQHNVYYMPDKRPHADKRPSKELFITTWNEYSG